MPLQLHSITTFIFTKEMNSDSNQTFHSTSQTAGCVHLYKQHVTVVSVDLDAG